MDDQLNDKLKKILADPDSLKNILEIASAFKSGSQTGGTAETKYADVDKHTDVVKEPEEIEAKTQQEERALSLPAISNSLTSTMSRDDRVNLLLSIKPFLNDKKRQRVDSLVKALGAARMISAYKDTDIFSNFGFK